MIRKLIYLFFLLIISHPAAAENDTCTDPKVIQEWAQMAQKHASSDDWQRFHAIWLGLCEKVRQGGLDQSRANRLFEEERETMMRKEKRRQHDRINPFG